MSDGSPTVVLLEYTLAPDVDVQEVEHRLRGLVAYLRAAGMGVHYWCYRKAEPARSYAHFGVFPNEQLRKDLQATPPVAEFISFLGGRCEARPRLTIVSKIASTDDVA